MTKRKRVIREGWRTIFKSLGGGEEGDDDQSEESVIPAVALGQIGMTSSAETKEGKTTAPPRYTEGNLIPLMKSAGRTVEDKDLVKALNDFNGLGTEATRSGIIQTLKNRKYIEIKSNLVYPTQLGRYLFNPWVNRSLRAPSLRPGGR